MQQAELHDDYMLAALAAVGGSRNILTGPWPRLGCRRGDDNQWFLVLSRIVLPDTSNYQQPLFSF
jgi:hypothetical protein